MRTISPRTWRYVWRRAREIVRDRGWRGLVFTVLADLGYHRFLLLERRLDEAIPTIVPRVSLTFDVLGPAALDEYLCFHDLVPRAQLAERFARGDECFLARHDGRIVSVSWVSREPHFFRSMRCRYELRRSEVYLYDAFTDPAWRGRAVAPALAVHLLARFRAAGATRATVAVAPENAANRRARAKSGFRLFGRIDYLRVGRWSRHWHRGPLGSCDRAPPR